MTLSHTRHWARYGFINKEIYSLASRCILKKFKENVESYKWMIPAIKTTWETLPQACRFSGTPLRSPSAMGPSHPSWERCLLTAYNWLPPQGPSTWIRHVFTYKIYPNIKWRIAPPPCDLPELSIDTSQWAAMRVKRKFEVRKKWWIQKKKAVVQAGFYYLPSLVLRSLGLQRKQSV